MTSIDIAAVLPEIFDIIGEKAELFDRLAVEIWEDPELSFQEFHACAKQVELLKQLGFTVEENYTGLETAYRAERRTGKGGKTFAFCSEYDALVKIGHGCGHNLICASGCAAAWALAEYLERHGIAGRVVLFGTPGEERAGGKVSMSKAGCLNDIDAVMMLHPGAACTRMDGGSTGIITAEAHFTGKASHAAGSPYKGINALDAQILLQNAVGLARQQMRPGTLIHGIISAGGEMANVIPDKTVSRYCLRSRNEADLADLYEKFKNMVKGAELMTGTSSEVKFLSAFRPRNPNAKLNNLFIDAMEFFGVGKIERSEAPGLGSSDFGDFSQVRPGAHTYIGIALPGESFSGHSVELAQAARSEFGREQALRGAAALAWCGLNYLSDETVRNEVNALFAASKK